MGMAAGLLVTILLAFACGNVVSQTTRHFILWDRFWLANNLVDYTLNVSLNDAVTFNCSVENTEPQEDRVENIVLLAEEQHLVECDVGTAKGNILGSCVSTGDDHFLPITDALALNNRPSFAAGEAYYFTSFSDGTRDSAETAAFRGGACALDPPLRLTISISATPSSFPSSTATTTDAVATTSTRNVDNVIPTSTVATTSSSQVTQPTSIIISRPTTPSIRQPEALSGAGLLSPVHSVISLSIFITCILIL